MNSISLISSIAMAMGLAGAVPQILRMITSRSAGGQSVVGWGMGCVTNVSLAYVNFFGFGAKALAMSNVLSMAMCLIAMTLIIRFRETPAAAPTADDLDLTIEIPLGGIHQPATFEARRGHLAGLPTTEFDALREVVLSAEQARREARVESTPRELVAQPA